VTGSADATAGTTNDGYHHHHEHRYGIPSLVTLAVGGHTRDAGGIDRIGNGLGIGGDRAQLVSVTPLS